MKEYGIKDELKIFERLNGCKCKMAYQVAFFNKGIALANKADGCRFGGEI